ncbi:MAG: PilZ domain-containing protein [Candidatus Eremiobacterota bacterium]
MFKGLIEGFRSFIGGRSNLDYSERRKLIRLRCHYDVQVARVLPEGTKGPASKKFNGTIVEMGLEGMRLKCFEALKRAQLVDVSYLVPIMDAEVTTVRCEVMWTRTRERDYVTFAGLRYVVEDQKKMSRSWVKSLLRELGMNPKNVHQKRRFLRADCFIPAQYVLKTGEVNKDSKLYNLGVSGALVESRKEVPVGVGMDLRIGPYEGLGQFAVQARTVKCTREAQSKIYQVGVEFVDLSSAHLRLLTEYMKLLMKQNWCE